MEILCLLIEQTNAKILFIYWAMYRFNAFPIKISQWHYFELKLLEKQQIQGGNSDPPLSPGKQRTNLSCERYTPHIWR